MAERKNTSTSTEIANYSPHVLAVYKMIAAENPQHGVLQIKILGSSGYEYNEKHTTADGKTTTTEQKFVPEGLVRASVTFTGDRTAFLIKVQEEQDRQEQERIRALTALPQNCESPKQRQERYLKELEGKARAFNLLMKQLSLMGIDGQLFLDQCIASADDIETKRVLEESREPVEIPQREFQLS